MTNGEKIQQDFECEVCEPIPEDDIIHVIFSDKNDSAIGFDLSWWNMEYKESILDKIRAEIAELSHYYPMGHDYQIAITRCIAVIDKYKAEK